MYLADVLPFIKPGVFYIVLGTIEQTVFVCRKLGLEYEFLYEPQMDTLRRRLEYPSDPSTLICYYSKPQLASPKLLRNKGEGAAELLLPSDSFFSIDSTNYAFLPILGLSEDLKAVGSLAKKLEGGRYELLDLRSIEDLPLLPYVCEHEKLYGRGRGVVYNSATTEENLFADLVTLDGVERWGRFTPNEVKKWFIYPRVSSPYILRLVSAPFISPFLLPFSRMTLDYWGRGNPSSFLKRFALWVYFSTEYWGKPNYRGLVAKQLENGKLGFYFFPSPKARLEWRKLVSLSRLRSPQR